MSGPIVVVGDALLDVDLDGSVTRVVPDAPALVVDSPVSSPRAGGAGLAALLTAGRSEETVLVAPMARDASADTLRRELSGVRLLEVAWQGSTTVKQRIRASDQTLLRLDYGAAGDLGPMPAELPGLLASARAVLVSDYGRGALTSAALRHALGAIPRRTPIVWDPHPRGGSPIDGTMLVTPNRHEASAMADASGWTDRDDVGDLARVESQASHLLRTWRCSAVAVTLGRRGALLSYGADPPQLMPARPADSLDPCGAGDCFAAAATTALADGASLSEAVHDAVAASTRFVHDGGAHEFASRRRGVHDTSTIVATSGCFDLLHPGHVEMLNAARGLGDRLVVLLNSDASVRRLKGPGRPVVPQTDRAQVLSALACVDEVIVFDEDTPAQAIRRLRPQLWVKGADYADMRLPEQEALAECGARTVLLPYLEGHSTTALVRDAARARSTEGATP